MLRKYVAGAFGALLWQLTPVWSHPHHGFHERHNHPHHGDIDEPVVSAEGHGFHEVGHWEIDNSFLHLDAKVFEHAKELHDEHLDEWEAEHAEEQRAKDDSYKSLTRESCTAATGEFPMVNMEGRGDEDCKCAACVIKGSKFIMGMIVRGVEKKCSHEEIKMLSDEHGDSGAVSSWDFDAMSTMDGKQMSAKEKDGKPNHDHHWNPERMRKWFCHAYKGHPEVVLGFLAYHMRPMQSAAGWCMGAGHCKKHHDFKGMALEHASVQQHEAGGDMKLVNMNEKHHWMHMGLLPQFLKGATKSFMSVGHDGEMEDDHWAEMKDFWAQEKASWGKYIDREDEQVDQDHKEDSGKEDEEKKNQLEAEAKAAAEKEEKKKEEQQKLEEMKAAEETQVVQARMLHEAEGEDVVQKHHSWLGSMFGYGKHGPHGGHGKGKHGMQCKRMKMCMRMAMGWAMKWAVKKTMEMCQKCTNKKVQMMCKWAGAHKQFAFGMLVAHVAPWKFAMGRCLHRHRPGQHGGAEWPGHHHGHHHGDHHGHHGERPLQIVHRGPFAPLLSWLPFVEVKQSPPVPEVDNEHKQEMEKDKRYLLSSFPLMAHTRGLIGRLLGGGDIARVSVKSDEDGKATTTTTDTEGNKVTSSTHTDENGTVETKEVKGQNFYVMSKSFRSAGVKDE